MSERRRKAKMQAAQLNSQLAMAAESEKLREEKDANRRAKLDRAGSFAVDVAKYVLTGVIISPMVGKMGNDYITYGAGLILFVMLFFIGIVLTNRK